MARAVYNSIDTPEITNNKEMMRYAGRIWYGKAVGDTK